MQIRRAAPRNIGGFPWRAGKFSIQPVHTSSSLARQADLLSSHSLIPQIHLDRYKRSIYKLLPTLTQVQHVATGSDPRRFHACDLENRCDQVGWTKDTSTSSWKTKSGSLVVNINPAELRVAHWDIYRDDLEKKLAAAKEGKGAWPTSIVRPLFLLFSTRRSNESQS